MKELEVMTIDNKDYLIMKEVFEGDTSYVFLSNSEDPEDVMIRKSSDRDKNLYVPLENDEEYHLATLLFFKDSNKKND